MKRLLLLIGVLILAGCTRSTANFWAIVEPARGHVPFEATITAADIGDSYTFHLPNESITQARPVLEVIVDSMDWTATVETSCGGQLYADGVSASGSNAPPRVENLVINGIRDRWYLVPKERTLLAFELSPGAELVDVDVWGSGFAQHYSIFIAPYDGDYHAVYLGRYCEDACIVYPMYCSIPPDEPGQTLPYAPTGLETGYPFLIGRRTNVWDFGGALDQGPEIPAQQGFVQVTVQDDLGQRTTETLKVPIKACDYV